MLGMEVRHNKPKSLGQNNVYLQYNIHKLTELILNKHHHYHIALASIICTDKPSVFLEIDIIQFSQN